MTPGEACAILPHIPIVQYLNMDKTQKQLQSEQTQRQIIAKATELFVRKGFFGTSISDLAKATGLTKGAFYHHFENKDALFFAVIQSVRETWYREVGRNVLTSKNALTRLTALIENHTRMLIENEELCLLLNGLVMEMDGTNPEFMTALQEVYRDMASFIEKIVQKGQNAGQIREDLDPRMVAFNMIGMLRGIGCSPIFKHMGLDSNTMAKALNKILIDGLHP